MLFGSFVRYTEKLEESKRESADYLHRALRASGVDRERCMTAISTLLSLPTIKPSFIYSIVTSLLPKLLDDLKEQVLLMGISAFLFVHTMQAGERVYLMELFRVIMERAPQAARAVQKQFGFVGQHLNTGQRIGKGKFGKVYLGYSVRSGVPVAIKVLDTQLLAGTAGRATGTKPSKAWKQLSNEIAIMKHVSHVNCVRLFEVVQSGGRLAIIMEYVGGGQLAQYMKHRGPIPENEACTWLQQLAAGLRYLREKNIIHRDLKPDNLLLTEAGPKGILKIADFGLGRFLGSGELADTHVGTPLYMAPEGTVFAVWQYYLMAFGILTCSRYSLPLCSVYRKVRFMVSRSDSLRDVDRGVTIQRSKSCSASSQHSQPIIGTSPVTLRRYAGPSRWTSSTRCRKAHRLGGVLRSSLYTPSIPPLI
jgi:hypothetical protein